MTQSVEPENNRTHGAVEDQGSDGFTLSFSDGRGMLTAKDLRINDAAVVDRLELIIPKVSFPFDMSEGVRGLRHYRHKLGRLSLTIFSDGLERAVRKRLETSTLFKLWTLSFERNHLAILLDEGPKEERRSFSLRLVPIFTETGLDLLIDTPIPFGPLEVNLLRTAALSIEAMFGIRPDGVDLKIPSVIKTALLHVLPDKGWRLPDDSEARLIDFRILADRITMRFAHPDIDVVSAPSLFGDEPDRLENLKIREESHITETGDKLITAEHPEEARRIYSKLSDRDPENPFVAARVAMVDMVQSSMRETTVSLAKETLRRHPDRRDLTAVLLHGAALLCDNALEISLLEKILDHGNGPERLGAGMRLGLLLLDTDPQKAAAVFERVASIRRNDKNAVGALMEATAKMGDVERVHRLIPRWLAAHSTPEERAVAHTAVGEMLLDLNDIKAAATHFERAAVAAPKSTAAAWGLAETLYRAGDAPRAVERFESLAQVLRQAGDIDGAARALSRLADIWAEKNEPSLAVQRLVQALDLVPDHPQRRIRLAFILAKMSQPAAAAKELEIAIKQIADNSSSLLLSEALPALAGLYLFELDDPEAARVAARQGLHQSSCKKGCEDLLRRALDRKGIKDLQSIRFGTPGEVSELARDLIDLRDIETALRVLEIGMGLYPENVEIADALIAHSRKAGDIDRLYKTLAERVETVVSLKRRADMQIELGELCLYEKGNPSAAICWFKSALEKMPSNLAEKGISAAVKMLQAQAERLLADGDAEAAEMIFQAIQGDAKGEDTYITRLGEAEAALHRGDWTAASTLAKGLFLAPREIRIQAAVITARVLAAEGQAQRAVRLLEHAVLGQSDNEKRLLYLAIVDISAADIEIPDNVKHYLEAHLEAHPEDRDADQALIKLLTVLDRRLDLAEYLSKKQEPVDRDRLLHAADLFLEEDLDDRAASVLETLYRETDAIEDLFLLVDVLKKQGRYEVLITKLEERRNEDPRVDERLKQELGVYANLLKLQGLSTDELYASGIIDPRRSTPTTGDLLLSVDADRPLQNLADDDDSLNKKLSSAFNRLRIK